MFKAGMISLNDFLEKMAAASAPGFSKGVTEEEKDELEEAYDAIKTLRSEMNEGITKSTPTSKVISDFVHSKNPKFKGKSKKERIRMALGAKYAMMKKEEYISELSSLRKKIYVNKATVDKEKHLQKAREYENAADVFSFSKDVTTQSKQDAARARYKALKRQQGINRATQSGIK
jgi:hypothetical protein